MRAAVLVRQGDSSLQLRDDVEALPPRAHEVTVRVAACGICHSDLAALSGSLWIPTPAVMGHEVAGVVEATGSSVTSIQVGDHVVVGVSMPCGRCSNCTDRGSPHLCEALFFDVAAEPHFTAGEEKFAAMGAIGGLADKVTVREEAVVAIPADLPLDLAALLGCGVSTGMGAVRNTARVAHGSSVAVVGVGGVGCAVIQAARIAGAKTILGIDVSSEHSAKAMDVGATDFCTFEELREETSRLTDDGFDYVFDVVGRSATMHASYEATRRGGTLCIVGSGLDTQTLTLRASEIYFHEKRVVGSFHGSSDFRRDIPAYVQMWCEGRLDLQRLVTHRYGFDEINQALQQLGLPHTRRAVVIL
jgi:S-(hydroxymethyl)glutathione dehydrogenase/alcohol dehydrogenase